ncbi:MAG TPA: cation:proton antiporter [Denitromonas sp.]|uniref:cation:proton antiporter n=1 Tax=Denitromonas sp. TaxID=2734609 RepID=UPI001D257B51|nr:cation:proton antiporter [Rhodocyclaceae bacterium]MCP5221902.1 cation:proton antiporter [Zoogloeaceae bacterium]HQV13574.1 cation:proton antiporter [Denitromonas sp.]
MNWPFLPAWPPDINGFILFGLLMLAGLLGGEAAHRSGFVPRITGFIAIGFVLGPSLAGVLTAEMLDGAQVFVDVALGLILFQLGRLLDLSLARRERSLFAAAIAEAGLAFAGIFAVLTLFDIAPMQAAVAAAIGISSSPAVVLLVVKELGAKGPLTDRSLMLVAMNNILSFLAYTALLPFIHYAHNSGWEIAVLEPLYVLGVSLGIAGVFAWLLLRLARMLPKDETTQFALLIGMVVGTVGVAQLANGSMLLSLLALGVMTRNLDRHSHVLPVDFGNGGEIFFVILFVVAGARLHLADLSSAGFAAVAFVLARFVGKSAGVMLLTRAGLDFRQSALTGLTLVPMAGMAIGLTQMTAARYPEFAATLSAIVLGAIVILETIGPLLTEYALKQSGEVPGILAGGVVAPVNEIESSSDAPEVSPVMESKDA